MAGVEIKIDVKDDKAQKKLRALLRKTSDLSPVLDTIGESLLNSTDDRFKSQTSPEGAKWAAHSPRTIQARLARSKSAPLTILRMRGHLVGSIAKQVSGDTLKVGTNKDHGAIHQFGGKAGRGRKVTIPARPYIGMSADDWTEVNAILDDFLAIE